jgi:dienelactone hydrolase
MNNAQHTGWRAAMAAAVLIGVASLGGCAALFGKSPGASEAAETRYAGPGPHEVGVATLKLADRSVEVYYPAAKGSTAGKPREKYLQTDPLPQMMLARLPKVPDGVDLSVTIPAVRGVPAATGQAFPLVIFSHGAGGWRSAYGEVLSGLASWGFVVASTDYTEYGFMANFGGGGDMTRRRETVGAAVTATIDLLAAENTRADSPLKGAVSTTKIGAVGHSAGGGTMFGQLNNPRINAIVGWAPVPPQTPVMSTTPTMIIAGDRDIAITAEAAGKAYDTLNAPKRLVVVKMMGHNAFSDTCFAIRGGTDLIGIAKGMGLPIPDRLLALAANGCAKEDLDTREGMSIIQHFTVAELRASLGLDRRPVGLSEAAARGFKGVTIDYREQLK